MKILSGLTLIILLSTGCLDDNTPTNSTSQPLVGTWILPLAEIPQDEFQFSYLFKESGTVTNTLGGAFLQSLRDLAEAQELDLGDLSKTDQIDGADLKFTGTWTVNGDSLYIHYTDAVVELFGNVPIIGRIGVPVYSADLSAEDNVDVHFIYSINSNKLNLRGDSLTLGISLDPNQPAPPIAALGSLGNEALRLAIEQLGAVIQQENLTEVVLERD